MSAKLLVKNALLLTLDDGDPDGFLGWFTVDAQGRIAALAAGTPPANVGADVVLDVEGALVGPGFLSAHSHLFTSGSRGLGMDQPLYGWIAAMTAYTRHADADDVYWCTLHGALDFVGNGITTAYDFTDTRLPLTLDAQGQRVVAGALKPPAFAEAQVRGKVDAGLRFINSVMLDEELGTDEEVMERFGATLRYAETFAASGLYLGSAISGAVQWATRRDTAALEVSVMRRFGVINQPHFLETAQEVELQRSKWAWYREAGAFGPDLVFGHFVQATPEMIVEAGRCGCGMVWQPTSNGRLASASPISRPVSRRAFGWAWGLTTSPAPTFRTRGRTCAWASTRSAPCGRTPPAMKVRQMLRLHTLGSAEVLGIADKVGSLSVGKYADFLVVDPRDPDTGPVWDPVGTYVLACGQRNLKAVYRGGDLTSREGRSTNPKAAEASAELHRRLRAIAARVEATQPTG